MNQKILICLTIAISLVMLLTGCADAKSQKNENGSEKTTLPETEQAAAADTPSDLLSEQDYEVAVCNARSHSTAIFEKALNADRIEPGSHSNIPVYKLDTAEDLAQFEREFYDDFSWSKSHNELPSFSEVRTTFDEAFFENNALLLAYVSSASGTYRYDVRSVRCDGKSLCITVYQTLENLELVDALGAGWLVLVTVPDSLVSEVTVFDAILE